MSNNHRRVRHSAAQSTAIGIAVLILAAAPLLAAWFGVAWRAFRWAAGL